MLLLLYVVFNLHNLLYIEIIWRYLKFRAAKYYNELPEDIKFELYDSEKYNKSALWNYLFNTEHWSYHIYTKSNYLIVNLFEIKTWLVSSPANV